MECTSKQIHHLWLLNNQERWKLNQNALDSALKLLERVSTAENDIQTIPLYQEPGMFSLAFALKKTVAAIGSEVAEVALDGTCKFPNSIRMFTKFLLVNTNSSGFELTALIAECNGQGVPLGFILSGNNSSGITPLSGAKTRILASFLEFFKPKLPMLEFTITDKEMAEIDAFQQVFPHVKHQLCHWHGIRTVEGRLVVDKPTSIYNPELAHKRFPFIDPKWKPGCNNSKEDAALELESGGITTRISNQETLDWQAESAVSSCHFHIFSDIFYHTGNGRSTYMA
jgi:hypothetical protein